ncbi:MAG: trigger factor [Anaerolineaceae bacterium]|nr:trigger factor [Anaerolineaceae bacterium]
MKIATEDRDDHQVTLIAEIEPQEYEKSKHQAARKISQERRIPGFRPGKAPYDMVRRFAGEEVIRKQALDILIDEIYPKALDQADIKPGAPGQLESISEEEPVKLTFTVPLAPSVELGDYNWIRQEYTTPEVTDTEIEKFIERLRTSYATYEPVERPAEEGDMVGVTIRGILTHPEEGQNVEVLDERPLTVLLKPDTEHPQDEWPFPGFALQLAGASVGDEKVLIHQFSDDSPYSNLKGKEIEFEVKIDSIKKMNLPELNDEFAQSVGEFSDIAALRASVRQGLEANANEEYDRDYFVQLTDKLVEGANIKYPPQLLDKEVESVLRSIQEDLARQNMDLDTYLKVRSLDRETFINDEVRPSAVRRLKKSLVFDEIARVEDIHVENAEIEATFSQTMAEIEKSNDFGKLRKQLSANRLANAVALESINRVMNRSVLTRLKAIATGEIKKPAEAPDEAVTPTPQPADAEDLASSEANPAVED